MLVGEYNKFDDSSVSPLTEGMRELCVRLYAENGARLLVGTC